VASWESHGYFCPSTARHRRPPAIFFAAAEVPPGTIFPPHASACRRYWLWPRSWSPSWGSALASSPHLGRPFYRPCLASPADPIDTIILPSPYQVATAWMFPRLIISAGSAASRARPWLIVSSRRELLEKGVATRLVTSSTHCRRRSCVCSCNNGGRSTWLTCFMAYIYSCSPAHAAVLSTGEWASLFARTTSHASCHLWACTWRRLPPRFPSARRRHSRSRDDPSISAPANSPHLGLCILLKNGERTESPLHPCYWFHLQFV
jgi:hypothetical protein